MPVPSPDVSLSRDREITKAYSLYAKFYAPVAVCVFWIVWRGSMRKHIAWYAAALASAEGKRHLDVATGDGALFALVHKRAHSPRFESLTCLDFSEDMLSGARAKLADMPATEFVLGSILSPPALVPFDSVTCFGGFNVFEDIGLALRQIHALMLPGASFSGSALLQPETPWRQRQVATYARKGYMTRCPSEGEFRELLEAAGLRLVDTNRHGDNFLFRAERPLEA